VQLSDGGSLVVTYNTNVPFDALGEKPNMYWPRLIKLDAATLDP
jgi:hypothetical protein